MLATRSSCDLQRFEKFYSKENASELATSKSTLITNEIELKWKNILIFSVMHVSAIYGATLPLKTSTCILFFAIGIFAGFGTTVGSHRLFSHRAFKPNQKLKVLMVILQTMAGQEPILKWVRDHRVHHKCTDTDADPYNSRRGFFFSHIGWLCCKKHPEVIKQGKKIDMSDLENDPVLIFQQK
jgi:stearoyl-CoA desaturase (delta-9 desaturase)